MLISCSTASFLDPEGTPTEKKEATLLAMEKIISSNYDGIELFIAQVFTEEMLDKIFQETIKYPNRILTVHAPKNLLHKSFKEIFPTLGRFIKRVGSYHIPIIVLHPPFRPNVNSLLKTIFPIFDKMVDYAGKYKVTLTIENVPYLPNPPIFYEKLIERYKENVGITIDIEYLFSTEFPLEKYSLELLRYLKNIHVRDYDGQSFDDEGKRKYLRLGEGNINFSQIFKRLKEINYKGPLTVETSFKNPLEDLKYSKEFIEKNLS
ncbi:MAG: sugar phosphate isomerase/epimerase family protein [Dictyoglomaceae bacterium]